MPGTVPWTPEEAAQFLNESKRLGKVHRVHNVDGRFEQCTVVDPGPSRMGACLICGAVYLQEDKLRDLQMFHGVGQRRSLESVKADSEGLWCKKHVSCRGHEQCLPWYRRFWAWVRG